jgi:hypothetical protein
MICIHYPDAHDKTQYLDELDHPIKNRDITKNIGENLGFQTSTSFWFDHWMPDGPPLLHLVLPLFSHHEA